MAVETDWEAARPKKEKVKTRKIFSTTNQPTYLPNLVVGECSHPITVSLFCSALSMSGMFRGGRFFAKNENLKRLMHIDADQALKNPRINQSGESSSELRSSSIREQSQTHQPQNGYARLG